MTLTNVKDIGRYRNTETLKEYNIKKGRKVGYGVDILYYLYRGKRMIIPDNEFYGSKYIKI